MSASPSHLAEAALDRGRAAPGDSAIAAAGDQQRDEQEREQRKQQRHSYTSILITWRIQKKPMVCMTTAPISIVWPMRSRNSRSMCRG